MAPTVETDSRQFVRGEKISVSVRLRNKKDEINNNNKKKKNRHSGDFGFFVSNKDDNRKEIENNEEEEEEEEGDWSYITFPNQDSTNLARQTLAKRDSEEPVKTPVKVVTRQVPGLFPLRPKSKRSSGDFSEIEHKAERRKSEGAGYFGASRQCSEEFAFKLPDGTSGPAIPEETSTKETREVLRGLGKRSVTQINMLSQKKHSYKSALCKSQENLVKASVMSDERSLEKEKSTLKKGLLWQQKDKLFSRWKERYFILTKDYLHCFKRGTSKITEMGGFIFKIKCSDVEDVELLDKRGYLTICISLPRDGKVYLRKTEGIREWFSLLKDCVKDCKKRRKDGGFWARKQVTDSSSIEHWLQARKKIGLQYAYSGSTPEINKISSSVSSLSPSKAGQPRVEITLRELSDLYKNEEEEERRLRRDEPDGVDANRQKVPELIFNSSSKPAKLRNKCEIQPQKKINRLSLMSDIELPDCCNQDLGIDLEKGIFLRKKCQNLFMPGDTESNDSGNNSMNTNGSVGSSSSSSSTHNRDERLETHFEDMELNDESSSDCVKIRETKRYKRRSQVATSLQITHV